MKQRLIAGIVHAKYPEKSAGHQCSMLHWLLGFKDLGWDVWIVEELPAESCLNTQGERCAPEDSIHVASWNAFVADHGFTGRASLFIDGSAPDQDDLVSFADGADLFLNYAGQFSLLPLVSGVRCKAYLDVDPGYTQTWAKAYQCNMNFEGHDAYITVGAAFGRPECCIPQTGHDWIPTFPPVYIPFYETRSAGISVCQPWSTVTHWYGVGEVECDGMTLRSKRDSFLPLVELPAKLGGEVLIASDVKPDWEDYAGFYAKGWRFCDAGTVCESIDSYIAFMASSRGELGVAKEGYVTVRTGWFSDRSVAYLACGRPVVALETGWSVLVPETLGLLPYRDADEAVAQMRRVETDYEEAVNAARKIADDVFSSRVVLPRLLNRLGVQT